MKKTETTLQECCPPFDPEPWDDITQEWDNKLFVKEKVCTFFYIPLNFGRKMRMLDRMVRKAGGTFSDNLCLSDHTSKWNMDVYLGVEREIPGLRNTTLSGKYYSRVYEGPVNETGKWCTDFERAAAERGMKIEKWYMWYTTCPECARKYGKNYTVIVCQVE
jgi:hypothetical protein